MNEDEVARQIVDAALAVHRSLGPGLFESVYEAALAHELAFRQLRVARQTDVAVRYRDLHVEAAFRADLVVNDLVVVEIKSVDSLEPVHKMQLLTYLRLMDKRLGLLINFSVALIKHGIHRIANNLLEN